MSDKPGSTPENPIVVGSMAHYHATKLDIWAAAIWTDDQQDVAHGFVLSDGMSNAESVRLAYVRAAELLAELDRLEAERKNT